MAEAACISLNWGKHNSTNRISTVGSGWSGCDLPEGTANWALQCPRHTLLPLRLATVIKGQAPWSRPLGKEPLPWLDPSSRRLGVWTCQHHFCLDSSKSRSFLILHVFWIWMCFPILTYSGGILPPAAIWVLCSRIAHFLRHYFTRCCCKIRHIYITMGKFSFKYITKGWGIQAWWWFLWWGYYTKK